MDASRRAMFWQEERSYLGQAWSLAEACSQTKAVKFHRRLLGLLPPSKLSTTLNLAKTIPSSAPGFQKRVSLEATLSAVLARRDRRVGVRMLSPMPACKIMTEYFSD